MSRKIHGDGIGLGSTPRFRNRVEGDGEIGGGRLDAEEPGVLVVVFVEGQTCRLDDFAGVHIADIDVVAGFGSLLAKTRFHQPIDVVAAISADDKRYRVTSSIELKLAGVTLVVVGVPGNDGMGINADVLADGVDIGEHERAAVVCAPAGTSAWGRVSKRRMMNRNDDCALIVIVLDVLQLSRKEGELVVGNNRPGWSSRGGRLCRRTRGLARDYSRIFKSIGEESDDADVRGVERKVDAGLGHRSAMQRSGFGGDRGGRRAEIPLEDRERLAARGSVGQHERIVIAGNGKDWRGIVAVRFVEFVVIVGGFSEVIDQISEMKKKRRTVCRGRAVEVVGYGVGDSDHGREGGLRRRPAVSDHVERDGLSCVDGLDNGGAVRSPGRLKREEIARLAAGLRERDDFGGEQGVDLAGIVCAVTGCDGELRRIGRGNPFGEDGFCKQGLRNGRL